MATHRHHVRFITTLAILFVAGMACKKEESAKAPSSPTLPGAPALGAAVAETTLAAADAHDGKTDKTISDCAMCALRMKGVAEHASTHSGYTLHFCSAACKGHFDEDATKAIAALNVPGK